jgi:hypothetical protein
MVVLLLLNWRLHNVIGLVSTRRFDRETSVFGPDPSFASKLNELKSYLNGKLEELRFLNIHASSIRFTENEHRRTDDHPYERVAHVEQHKFLFFNTYKTLTIHVFMKVKVESRVKLTLHNGDIKYSDYVFVNYEDRFDREYKKDD